VVEQAPRSADDDLRAARQRALLWTVRNATVNGDLVRLAVLPDRPELARYLERELPRRYDDERLGPF
jgi:hypothetical protein